MPRVIPELAIQQAATLPAATGVPNQLRAHEQRLWFSDGASWNELGPGILQRNTTASYTDSYGIVNTVSIARESSFDDGGIVPVTGARFGQRFSPTEEYDTDVAGSGVLVYRFNPSQFGSAYTARGLFASEQLSFVAYSIDKVTKAYLGTRYLTIQPEAMDDPTGGGYGQKVVKVPNRSGTLALAGEIQQPAPINVAAGQTYRVFENNQVPFMMPMTLVDDAVLMVDGLLFGVC